MKTSTLLLAPVAGLMLLLAPARAEEPANTNVQEVQGILSQLSKLATNLTAKQDGAADFSKVLDELSKLAATATPATTKEEQAQESQLITFVKSLLALVPQVPGDAVDVLDADAGPVQVDIQSKAGAPKSNPSQKNYGLQGSTGLSGGSLSTGGLTTGSLNGSSRMSDAEWRAQFQGRAARGGSAGK